MPNKSKFNPIFIVFIILGIISGIFGKNMIEYLENDGASSITSLIFISVTFLVSFFIVPIIHEGGHLIMGLITGYNFVSFRIGSFTIIKENGKLVRKKFNIAGTGGQCTLTYKIVDNPQNIPYFWYNFGGVFFNFLTTILCIPIILFLNNAFVFVGFTMFAIISLMLGIINIIPTKATGVGTDGYNLILFKKSPADKMANYKLMLINAMQYQGIRLEEMPDNILKFTEEEKQCQFGKALTVIEANILMNKHDFKLAEETYRSILDNEDLFEIYKNECKCELMFCMLMNGYSSDDIDNLYKEIKSYISATEKTYIMRKRLMYAYYLIIKKDFEKASQEYILAKKMENTYPAKGEYLSEITLIDYVKDNFS